MESPWGDHYMEIEKIYNGSRVLYIYTFYYCMRKEQDLGLARLSRQNDNVGLLIFRKCFQFWAKIGITLDCLIPSIFHLEIEHDPFR